jgi:uncharacterized membrane protein YfcA
MAIMRVKLACKTLWENIMLPVDFYCIFIGLLSGVLAALCGIGGGVVLVPFFVAAIGLEQKNANATSLAVIILTAIAATIMSSGNNLVNWRIVIFTGIPAAMIAFFAAGYLKKIPNVYLTRLFSILIIVVGLYMLINSLKKTA